MTPGPSRDWDPEGVPRPGPVSALRVAPVSRAVLPNGISLLVAPRPSVPRVELRLSVPAGAAVGPSAAAAELLALGLPLGTATMDQGQLSERIQDLGGSLQVHQDQDRLVVQAAALSEAEEDLYRVVSELVQAPAFPANDLETEKAKLEEGLRMARADPHFLAAEELQRQVYGDHPYGRPEPSQAAVGRTGRRPLLDLWRAAFVPAATRLTVVGDVDPRRTRARLGRAFADWWGGRRFPRVPVVRARSRPEVIFLPRPGSVQTVLLVGASSPPPGHPDHLALGLASAVLGGSFTSRLMNNVREDKGYTYSPHARLEGHLRDSLATAAMEVRNEVTGAAYLELLYELGRLATVEVPEAELETNRNYLAGLRALSVQTQAGLASSLAQVQGYGLDHRYLEESCRQLWRTSAADVLAAARRYLAPGAITTVMVGDPAAAEQVRPLARVRMASGRRASALRVAPDRS